MSIFKSFDRFNPLPTTCDACRTKRGRLCEFDKKIPKEQADPIHSNIIPGFYSKKQVTKNASKIDLLIIADSHGGEISFFREQWSTLREINFISNFYLSGEPKSFHEQQIRLLLDWLESHDISWYFTDLVKCYVARQRYKSKDNFKIATNHCKDHLAAQLQEIEPSLVLCLGRTVYETFVDVKMKSSAEGNHGEYLNSGVLFSCFPSQNTANLWVRVGGWKKVQQKIKSRFKQKRKTPSKLQNPSNHG